MKGAAGRALRTWRGPSLLLLPVLVATLLIFMDANTFAWRAVGWIHEGFLAAYVDAESFVSGCF